MKCPHCLESFHETVVETPLMMKRDSGHGPAERLKDTYGEWAASCVLCPACNKATITIGTGYLATQRLAWPKGVARAPLPKEVTADFSDDYLEACAVLPDSAKASAALSRRCLQYLLKEKAGTKKRDLADQIQEVLDSKALPSHLGENLDAVRVVGNFAAHSSKSTHSGEILPVEPGEAEWSLDVLEQLFDFYLVAPERTRTKREALNKKLAEAGKPPLKS